MKTEDILGIAFWFLILLIAVNSVRTSQNTRQEIVSRVQRASPLILGAVLLGAFSGFIIGGKNGMIGNAIGHFLWSTWGVTIWAAQKSRATEEVDSSEGSTEVSNTGTHNDSSGKSAR